MQSRQNVSADKKEKVNEEDMCNTCLFKELCYNAVKGATRCRGYIDKDKYIERGC